MKVGVVCLTNTKDKHYFDMCYKTLSTLKMSENDIMFYVSLLESNQSISPIYSDYNSINETGLMQISYIINPCTFNYNRYVNIGLSYLPECDWYLVINNDLSFTKGWLSKVIEANKDYPDIESFCPFEPDFHPKYYGNRFDGSKVQTGYETTAFVCGWCIVMKRDVINKIGAFDERFEFWYQDNDYAETIKSKGIKHAIVIDSHVYHLREQSYGLLTEEQRIKFTAGARDIFINKWNIK